GVLGGIFAALIAPHIFSEVLEYPLLLALTFACRPGAMDLMGRTRAAWAGLAALVVIGWAAIVYGPDLAFHYNIHFGVWGTTAGIAAFFGLLAALLWHYPPHMLVAALGMYLTLVLLPSGVHRGE